MHRIHYTQERGGDTLDRGARRRGIVYSAEFSNNITSFYGSSCPDNGKGALNIAGDASQTRERRGLIGPHAADVSAQGGVIGPHLQGSVALQHEEVQEGARLARAWAGGYNANLRPRTINA
eukprot:8356744-Pyramimonas_sp.AAC.1